jgi:hypothetical protein
MHKCADRLATVAVEVASTPLAAQQDLDPLAHLDSGLQVHLDLEARLVSVRRVPAADSGPAVFVPLVLELDQAGSARLAHARVLSPEEASLRAGDLLRAEHLPLDQQDLLDSGAATSLLVADSAVSALDVLLSLIDALAASRHSSFRVVSFWVRHSILITPTTPATITAMAVTGHHIHNL